MTFLAQLDLRNGGVSQPPSNCDISQTTAYVTNPPPTQLFLVSGGNYVTPSDSSSYLSDATSILPHEHPPLREPLRFSFKGYTIWLEIEELSFDFSKAIKRYACDFGLQPIPRTHVTALYGADHLTEDMARVKFRKAAKAFNGTGWPDLKPVGLVTDVELDGVDGGLMDMAWAEVSFETSPEHERHLDTLYNIFDMKDQRPMSPWKPHASLAYDNPENSPLNPLYTANLVASTPSLLNHTRKVTGMSLWSTWGKMDEWECLDSFSFGGQCL